MMVEYNELSNNTTGPVPIPLVSSFHDKQVVNFYICHIGALMDNPERRTNFGLLQGNSRNHGVFGLLCYFEQLKKPFPACNECSTKYMTYLENNDWSISPVNKTCRQCHGFSLDNILSEGKYATPILSLPNAKDAPGISYNTRPGILTSALLLKVWEYAIKQYVYVKD